MNVRIEKIKEAHRKTLENLFEYYVYDLSEFLGQSVSPVGRFTFSRDQLNVYWQRADHAPFFIKVDGEIAGFALVRKYPADQGVYDIEQYFVLRKFRRAEIGVTALRLITEKYTGSWQIRVLKENEMALRFWQSAIEQVVGGHFTLSEELDIDLPMHFLRFQVL